MYKLDETTPPLYPVPPIDGADTEARPPKSALPLVEPLRERAKGVLKAIPYRILRNIRAISAGFHQNAAIDRDDVLWMWGGSAMAKLPECDLVDCDGVVSRVAWPSNAITPEGMCYIPQKRMENVLSVSVGGWYTMCVTRDHKLWGWGKNDCGQLGLGDFEDRAEPTFVMDNVKAVFAGGDLTYIVKEDDTLWRCGGVSQGVWADAIMYNIPAFFFPDVALVNDVGNSGMSFGFLVKTNGELWGWGANTYQIFPLRGRAKYDPQPMLLAEKVASATVELDIASYGFIIAQNGDLYSVGSADYYSGVPTTLRNRMGPEPIKLMENVADVYVGKWFTLVLLKDGRLYSFGENSMGQCGTGKASDYPTRKPKLCMHHVAQAAAGYYHGMALQTNGDLWIWGGDYGVAAE